MARRPASHPAASGPTANATSTADGAGTVAAADAAAAALCVRRLAELSLGGETGSEPRLRLPPEAAAARVAIAPLWRLDLERFVVDIDMVVCSNKQIHEFF